MNNIFLNNDPLLYRNSNSFQDSNDMYKQMYQQQLMKDMYSSQISDFIGDLDQYLKGLDTSVAESLQNDIEWQNLNQSLQATIQSEIINLVKHRLNQNPSIIDNINKQKDIIKKHQQTVKDAERQNIAELNDYMKNYSNMTFDEYKKIKEQK